MATATLARLRLNMIRSDLLKQALMESSQSFDSPSMRLFEWEPMGTIRCEATLGIPSHGQSLIFLFMYLSNFYLVYLSVNLSILYFLFLIKVAINSGFPSFSEKLRWLQVAGLIPLVQSLSFWISGESQCQSHLRSPRCLDVVKPDQLFSGWDLMGGCIAASG